MIKPRLYSYRRCPYAIRARLAIAVANITVEKIDIELKNKPVEMLVHSPKGTVPVLLLPDGRVIDESLDIMRWALSVNDPHEWLQGRDDELIGFNDSMFKYYLDCYKYQDRYPEFPGDYYREKAEEFIIELEGLLSRPRHRFLSDDQPRLMDMAIFPFVRQFAHVDKTWFYESRYSAVIHWLDNLITSDLFLSVMKK